MAALAATREQSIEALLGQLGEARALDPAMLFGLAERIHRAHASAAAVPGEGTAQLRRMLELAPAAARAAQSAEIERHAAAIDARAAARRARAKGANGAVDVLLDLAAVLAELWAQGLKAQANIIANRYVDVSPQGASGWALLPLFVSLQTEDGDLAARVLAPSPPRLVAIGGLSGTGKSTLSRLLGCRMGRPPGARVLRSDVFRKRLVGVAPETRLPPSHYTRQSDQETFEAMFESADDHLSCGTSVILDAVFMSRSEREVAEMLADRRRVPFTGIWLEAPERDRIARVAARDGDASDAGVEVVREQSRRSVGDLAHWHRMRVNRPLDLIVPAARAVLDRGQR